MVKSMSSTTRNTIVLFLIEVKMAISNREIEWVPRTFDDITRLGIDLQDALEIIQALTPNNYYRGPSPDFNGDGTRVWEFIYELDGMPIYIKIKFQGNECKILSFHRSIKPYYLPYFND